MDLWWPTALNNRYSRTQSPNDRLSALWPSRSSESLNSHQTGQNWRMDGEPSWTLTKYWRSRQTAAKCWLKSKTWDENLNANIVTKKKKKIKEMNLNSNEEAEVSLHEREFLVDREQRSFREVFGWRHKRLVQQHLTLEFREGHQRLRKGRKKDAFTHHRKHEERCQSQEAAFRVLAPGCLHTDLEMPHHLSCYQTIFQLFRKWNHTPSRVSYRHPQNRSI